MVSSGLQLSRQARGLRSSIQASRNYRAVNHPAYLRRRYLPVRWCRASRVISTRALNGGVGPESRNHPISPFDGVFVACRPLQQFLRPKHVSYGDLPIDFREERWAGIFGQFRTPVRFFRAGSLGELAMMRRISDVAACCSSASLSSRLPGYSLRRGLTMARATLGAARRISLSSYSPRPS